MRALLQRVTYASVTVEGHVVGQIGQGLLILLGVGHDDGEAQAKTLADKIAHLRIFEDEQGKMNRSLLDIGGQALVVSQFTLYADTRRGRRPSFTDAAPPALAEPLVERFKEMLAGYGFEVFPIRVRKSLRSYDPVSRHIFPAEPEEAAVLPNSKPPSIWE